MLRAVRAAAAVWTSMLAVAVGCVSSAQAVCVVDVYPWSSTTGKTLVLVDTFPSGMRTAIQSGVQKWNITGSALVFATPLYTSSWLLYAFRGQMASFSALGLAPVPGYAEGHKIAPSHSDGAILFNTAYAWVNGSQNIPSFVADTETVTVHEVGHLNGMNHPDECGTPTADELASVMTAVDTGTRRNLGVDDIAYQTSEY